MDIVLDWGILVFLVAVIAAVLLGPGGDGLRRESPMEERYASRPLMETLPARPHHTVTLSADVTNQMAETDHSELMMRPSGDLAGLSELGPEIDPTESHHINNFTL